MNIVSCLVLASLGLALSRADCPGDEAVEWGSYGYFQTCRSHHIRQALQENVMCKPSPTVVQLPLPNNTDVQQMTPTFVEILQCGGACHRANQECVATKTREKKIPVMLARCGISTGKCEKECASVTLQEHTECGCDCGPASEQSCPSGSHMFNRDTCQCTCADSLARQACLDTGRAWSEESCSCACAVSPGPACSVGLAWSPVTCTCAPEQLIALETEERRERSGPGLRETFLSWQMVTIIVLLLLIFLLIITIFALISKLQTAKRRIKTAKIQASAQLTAARQGSEPLYDPLYSKTNNTPKDVIVKTKGAKNPDKLYSEIYSQQQAAETGASPHQTASGGAGPGPYCESPSSGFGSEASKYSNTDLRADNAGPGESIYHSAQTVRLNKKLQNIVPAPAPLGHHQPAFLPQQQRVLPQQQQQQEMRSLNRASPGAPHYSHSQPQYPGCCGGVTPGLACDMTGNLTASEPIDEAIRLLEHSASMLN